jgi:Inner membrane component of T3SS, cytoplasmic domain
MSIDPMGGGSPYATGQPEQAPGGVCSSCGRDLPPPDLEAVAASIDHTLSLESGKLVPRTAWAGRPPDGVMDSLLFWLPSVKANRRLWERGQALWTEAMTAALSGPCANCQGATAAASSGQSAATLVQGPDQSVAGPAPAPTAYLPYEQSGPPTPAYSGTPATGQLPVHDEPADAMTAAFPAHSDYESAHAPPAEDAPTSAMPHFAGDPAAAEPSAVPAGSSDSGSDEHESHTVILSSMPNLRTGTRLVVLEGPVHGRQFSLGRDRTTIGRSIGCHVTIEADTVEYDHASVVRAGGGWQIELAGSAAELYVNEEPVQGSRSLRPGDVIRIGPARLRFETGS